MTDDARQSAPVDPTRRLAPVVRIAPAKLNLTLSVVARRDDGYHSLHSVFAPLGLADRLSLALAGGGEDTLHVSGFDPGETADNLVLRAIAATRAAIGRGRPGGSGAEGSPQPGSATGGAAATPALAARLDKRIPVAAGLGGGSSDAAAAIDGALEAWGADLDPHTRLSVAAAVGSDVPFFLAGGLALVEGRGETVARLDGLHGTPGVLLVTPAVAVSTRDVFDAFDAIRTHGDGAVRLTSMHLAEELRAKLSTADLVARAGAMTVANDLLPATALVVPSLVPFRRSLSRLLGRPVGLSGSGPTLWALYASEAEAADAATVVRTALEEGRITAPGSASPFVGATHIQTGHQHGSQP
jgi:4-diphosphocytidyl-2-C-methyl-D-erythritol kinase